MANNSPWSVKGVDPEAREAAKIAARKQGVNVGKWLSQTILSAASEELRTKRQDAEPNYADNVQSMHRPPRDMPREEPVYREPPRQEPPPGGPPALTAEAVLESIQKLANRIEQSEHRTTEAIQPIAEKVGELSGQIEEIKSKSGASTAPVERAMMRLSERLDRMEDTSKGPSRPSRTSDSDSGFLGRLFGRE